MTPNRGNERRAVRTFTSSSWRAASSATARANPAFTLAARMIRFRCNDSQSLAARSLRQPARGGSAMFRRKLIVAVAASVALAGFGDAPSRAQNSSAQQSQPAPAASPAPAPSPAAKFLKTEVPAYHAEPPKGALPDTLDPAQFSDAQTRNIYTLAAKVKPVLYQEPCYCGCDKEVGHKSLLDCFTDYHGAHCILCKKEAAFTYRESQQGKTAAEIRKEIIDGKWKEVDLAAYDTLPAAK